MDQFLTQHRPQIADLCRRFRVHRLELFGSAATDCFDAERSDVDFLVDFEPLAEGEHADAYFGLLAELESLLSRPIDLVMTRAIRNRYFLEAIEPTRTLLYAA
jgi:predicted nucleotidyltransferase